MTRAGTRTALIAACLTLTFVQWSRVDLAAQSAQGGPRDTPALRPEIQSRTEPGEGLIVRQRSEQSGRVRFASAGGRGLLLPMADGADPEARGRAFARDYGTAFGVADVGQLRLQRADRADMLGIEHVRFDQLHLGVPVFGGELFVHMRGARVVGANGNIVDNLPTTVIPTVAAAAALEAARDVVAGLAEPPTAPEFSDPRLEIIDPSLLGYPDTVPHLAWFVEATGPALDEAIWVDAGTGAVLLHYSQVSHVAGAPNRTVYKSPNLLLPQRSEGDPPTGDADVDAAYLHAGITYDFFYSRFGLDSVDGQGAILKSVVDPGCDWYETAFTSFEYLFRDEVLLCAGVARVDDVVGHEWSHGVSRYSANFASRGEPGVLSESFSDVFGETIDLLDGVGTDTSGVKWLIGEDLSGVGAIRSMARPELFNAPGKVTDGTLVCDPESDNGGRHRNAGIPNHAYALAVDGGTYNGRTITGVGLEKAVRIWYYALATKLGKTSTFWDLYTALSDSCSVLTGSNGITPSDCAQVQAALDAVEMNMPFCARRSMYSQGWTYSGMGTQVRDSIAIYADGRTNNTIHEETPWNPNKTSGDPTSGVDPSPLIGYACAAPPCRFPRFAMERRGPRHWVPRTDTYTRLSDDYQYSLTYHYRITSTFTLDTSGLLTGHAWFDDWQEFGSGAYRASSNRQFDWTIDLETGLGSLWWYNDTTYLPFEGASYWIEDRRRYSYAGRITVSFWTTPPAGISTASGLWTLNPTPMDATISTPLTLPSVENARGATRLAADGRSAMVLMFQSDVPDPVTFTVSALPGSSNFGLSGYLPTYLTNPQPNRSLQLQVNPVSCQARPAGVKPCTFLALLWAPDSMPPQMPTTQGGYTGVVVTATATQGSSDPVGAVVTIVPPPLVTIDGGWDGTSFGWGQFNRWIAGKYPHDVVVQAQSDGAALYGATSNQMRLQGAISEALVRARSAGLVARRVDVLAHGTGGIIVRCFLEYSAASGCGQTTTWPEYFTPNPVHQVVFVATPHTASPLVADLFSHRNDTTGASDPLVLAACGPGCTLGTALDKVVGMPLNELARAFNLPFGTIDTGQPSGVEYRSIVGIAPANGGIPSSNTQQLLDAVTRAYLGKTVATELGGALHDTIVTAESQRGSANPALVTSVEVPGVVHRSGDGNEAETQSSAVWLQALRFLTESSVLFPRAGDSTEVGLPTTYGSVADAPVLDLSGYTQVPASHLVLTPGSGTLLVNDTVTITATSPDRTLVQFLLLQRVDDPSDVPFRYAAADPFDITIQPRRLGTFQFTAIGIFDDQTYAVVNATFTAAIAGSGPMSLTLTGNSLVPFAVGETRLFRVEAETALGLTVDVTTLATYTPRGGSVFSVATDGAVTGLATGADWLDVSYGGRTTSALVTVGACSFALGAPGGAVPAGGGAVVLPVSADAGCVWHASSDVPWATVTPASGSGNALLTVTFDANAAPATRYAPVTLGDQREQIAQFGTACAFAPVQLPTVEDYGGVSWFSVGDYTSCGLTVRSNAVWVHAVMADNSVIYYVDPNPSPSPRSTTIAVGGVPLTLRQKGAWPTVGPNLVQNGDFDNGLASWQTYATPDPSYIAAAVQWGVNGYELQFSRVPPPPGTSNQATVFQNTGAAVASGATLRATFSLRNTAPSRRRISVLLVDSNFSDLAVCTFWVPPVSSPESYVMRMHTTKAWSNASIYFYAATAGTDGGFYGVDHVQLYEELVSEPADRTECSDATAPGPVGTAVEPSLITNGDFESGQLAPWGLYGQIVSQVTNGVFQFYRPSGMPAGVVLQNTGEAMTANQILTARFDLGNSSSVRKRVTALIHDSNFSDLSACTFWLPPGQPLSTYTMRAFTTQAWANATISIYPATVGVQPWFELDNVSLHRSSDVMTSGTDCLEPVVVQARQESRSTASTPVIGFEAPVVSSSSVGAAGMGVGRPAVSARPQSAPMTGWREVGDGVWLGTAWQGDTEALEWQETFDLADTSGAVLTFASSLNGPEAVGEVQVRSGDGGWVPVATMTDAIPGEVRTIDVPLHAFTGGPLTIRLMLHGAVPPSPSEASAWLVFGVKVAGR